MLKSGLGALVRFVMMAHEVYFGGCNPGDTAGS